LSCSANRGSTAFSGLRPMPRAQLIADKIASRLDRHPACCVVLWGAPLPLLFHRAAPDPGVLNRAEWIKFVAPFFNREDVANQQFDAVSSVGARSPSLAARQRHVPAGMLRACSHPPTCMRCDLSLAVSRSLLYETSCSMDYGGLLFLDWKATWLTSVPGAREATPTTPSRD
jgi:hypothetical protein